MPSIDFTRYYRYDELTAALREFAAEHPQLAALSEIGRSHEGRTIWCMTITNQASSAAESKPSTWLDGNLHATEVTGTMGALHVIERLLTGYGSDQAITQLLDTRAFYVVPRANPDGAEQYLTWRAVCSNQRINRSTFPHAHGDRSCSAIRFARSPSSSRRVLIRWALRSRRADRLSSSVSTSSWSSKLAMRRRTSASWVSIRASRASSRSACSCCSSARACASLIACSGSFRMPVNHGQICMSRSASL